MKELKTRKIEVNVFNDSKYTSQPITARSIKDLKIIKFTGDMKQNTTSLLQGIHCNCGFKKDYNQIMYAYSDKIAKLRQQRNKFKDSFNQQKYKSQHIHETNKKLIQQIAKLESQIFQLKSNSSCQFIQPQSLILEDDKDELKQRIKQLQEQKLIFIQEYSKLESNFNQLNLQLIQAEHALTLKYELSRIKREEDIQREQVSDLLSDSVSDLFDDKMQHQLCLKENELLKNKLLIYQETLGMFDCSVEQLTQILDSHFNNMPHFQTQQEIDLYQMATQMNADLWKKKVEMEVRSIHEKKMQLKKIQQSLNKRSNK